MVHSGVEIVEHAVAQVVVVHQVVLPARVVVRVVVADPRKIEPLRVAELVPCDVESAARGRGRGRGRLEGRIGSRPTDSRAGHGWTNEPHRQRQADILCVRRNGSFSGERFGRSQSRTEHKLRLVVGR